jgi:hypothetical protein
MQGCLQEAALHGKPPALHRSRTRAKRSAGRRADEFLIEFLRIAPVRRLWRGRPGRPRVRPSPRQALRHRTPSRDAQANGITGAPELVAHGQDLDRKQILTDPRYPAIRGYLRTEVGGPSFARRRWSQRATRMARRELTTWPRSAMRPTDWRRSGGSCKPPATTKARSRGGPQSFPPRSP